MATHSSILACRIPWTEEPDGLHIVHGVAKSRTLLSDCLFHFQETWVRSLARTPSSILAWRILLSEKPGGLYIVHRAVKSQT